MKKLGKHIETTISTTYRGYGFADFAEFEEEIYISENDINTALHNDTVEIEITGFADKGRLAGKVMRVVKRSRTKFVGTALLEGKNIVCMPDNDRIYTRFILDEANKDIAGKKVYVEMKEWKSAGSAPHARVLEVLGEKGDHEAEMRSITLERGIVADFPPDVEREAQKLQQEHSVEKADSRRKDMRDTLTFTIDPETAKDFDDALSYKKLDNGNIEIGVHIADVAHFVQPGTALDAEARQRAFSTYLVDRTIPMLPEILSNDLCSLNPHEDKFAFSAVFEIDGNGSIHNRWFGRTIIHSNRRYSYEEAQEEIDSASGDHPQELVALNDLSKTLRSKRFQDGSVEFSTEEVRFVLDENGTPIGVSVKESLDTHKLIEEFMLLANQEVALEIERKRKEEGRDYIFMYRVHDKPDREKLEELEVFIQALGYDFNLPKQGHITGRHLNELIKEAEEKPEEGLVNTTMIRSMSKARYSTKNIGHFGLAFEHYTHFTSPIRRYPDLISHRLLWKYLNGEMVARQEYPLYEKIAEHASEQEITVMQAERESIKYKQVEYMQGKVGETFEGVVTGIIESGMFIEEKITKANGFVSLRSFDDDYYEYIPKEYKIKGKSTGTTYRLGDEVTFKLTSADLDKRQLDFSIVK